MLILKADQWTRPELNQAPEVEARVRQILESVRQEGSAALRLWSLQVDGFQPERIPLKEFRDYDVSLDLRDALERAADRIEHFAKIQRQGAQDTYFEDAWGRYESVHLPVERMAAYIPGGRFPLISTALMTLIPACVAGVKERIAFSPSDHPAIQAAAALAGATGFVRLGGAQAIAAAAFGSDWNPACDVVVGPGNAYVNAAKAQVQGQVRIDTLAGPSELLVVADETCRLSWIAADIRAQAEHDPNALSICVSESEPFLQNLAQELGQTEQGMGLVQLVHADSRDELLAFINGVAAEHLFIAMDLAQAEIQQIQNYGSLFIGQNSAVAFGDYCSGPNHTLPTRSSARFKGGLSVLDFLRTVTTQTLYDAGVQDLAPCAMALAEAEGLVHHYASIRIRKDDLKAGR
ncbi:MAG: histidinol dehydrogenase [Acidobacteria bacterium]|nr:histidinol dehydrogenase [Acidobacteriota bacterium]MCB9398040.1 histidinol dehydrogenase [Acidobacteriota bacterium]